MKQTIARIFHLFMALVVLASSMGFGVIEHQCLMLGKKTYLHTKPTICEADKKQNYSQSTHYQFVIKKTNCCQDKNNYENVTYNSSTSTLLAKFQATPIIFFATFNNFFFNFSEVIIPTFQVLAIRPPPIISRQNMLLFIQAFLL